MFIGHGGISRRGSQRTLWRENLPAELKNNYYLCGPGENRAIAAVERRLRKVRAAQGGALWKAQIGASLWGLQQKTTACRKAGKGENGRQELPAGYGDMVRVQSGALQGHVYRHSRTARPLPGGRLRQINDGKPAPLRREAGHRTRLTDSPRFFNLPTRLHIRRHLPYCRQSIRDLLFS